MYKTIPAANPHELTPSIGPAHRDDFRDWPRSHGDESSSRYSMLTEITRDNVRDLEVAWVYRSGDGEGNIQCNPVVVEGVMYVPTPGNHLVAVDATDGSEIWRFDAGAQPTKRGILYWRHPENRKKDRILFTSGTSLIALLADCGTIDSSFGENGRIKLEDTNQAGLAVHEDVVIVPGYKKHVYGYSISSGRLLWTFHTVPEPGEFGHGTWDRPEPVAANVWGGFSLDRRRGVVYVSTGSPKPNFIGSRHRGRNLFANCVIAIDARTGERLWHFQEVRHDIWDVDGAAPPILTTIRRGDRVIDVVVQVTKMGNTLVLDRSTGEPVYPFRLRRAPTSTVPGIRTWPYQPDLELPEPFSRQEFTLDDVTDIGEANRQAVLEQLKNATIGWFLPNALNRPNLINNLHGGANWPGGCVDPMSGMLYVTSNDFPWLISITESSEQIVDETKVPPTAGRKVYETYCMACHGANREGTGEYPSLRALAGRLHEPETRAVVTQGRNLMPAMPQLEGKDLEDLVDYLYGRDAMAKRTDPKDAYERPAYQMDASAGFYGYQRLMDHEGYHGSKPPWGKLNAIDLNTGRIKWQVPFGEYEELTERGLPITGTENFGGATVTAGGLVFCTGARDRKIKAYDAETGEELWAYTLPYGGTAPPTVYQADGIQYVVVPATGGGKLRMPAGDAFVAFKLNQHNKSERKLVE